MFAYEFMRNAFFASTFIAIVSGIIGVFVIARQLSFLAHTLSEIGFAGASFAVFMGISPLLGMLLFTLLSSVSVGTLSLKSSKRETAISVVSAFFTGLGILFLSLSNASSRYATNILFGSIISIDQQGVFQLIGLSVIVLISVFVLYRWLAFDSFDTIGADAQRLPTFLISILFLVLLAMSVSVGAQVVGSLLVFILITLPASTAKYLGKSVLAMIAWSVGLALLGVWGGLYLSYITNWPVTFFISSIEVAIYIIVYLFKRKA
ncbi:metal ABC transporter permease [Holzapfeliella floricola]|uniref:Metal cation ABC transporter membrane protein n=1 Tax=Holzapfeliella floricola DSM 23037 = JCM 16512 TaxID=1423744 RepID=A0A0R2DP67_9LACO|nr:metal ABC transporter permease [Holzapfeliella floricola]KRN04923.1 metal cation ABC transporter membrane protein [Holzapfeliella floricola DSM 23037 = JCM 16512]